MATRQDIFDFAVAQAPELKNEPFNDVVAFAIAQEPSLADELVGNSYSGIFQSAKAGFMGAEQKSNATYPERAAYAAGEYGPMLAGGALAAATLPATATAGAIAGATALGTYMTRALQRAGRQNRATATEEVLEPALQAAGTLAGPAVVKGTGQIVTKAAKGAGNTIRAVIDPMLTWFGKFNEESAEAVAKEWPKISKFVKYNNTDKPISEEQIAAAGKSVKDILEEGISKAQEYYKRTIDKVMSGKKYGEGFRIDLFNGTAKQQAEIMQEFQIGGRFPKLKPAENEFILDRLKQLGEIKDFTVREAYEFQEMLNAENSRVFAEVGKKTPYNAALGKLKSAVDKVLQKQVPEIAKANKAYANAFENLELGRKVVKADDPKTAIKSAVSRLTNTNDDLNLLAEKVPAIREAIDTVIYGNFAREAAPFFRYETLRGSRFPKFSSKVLRANEAISKEFPQIAESAISNTAIPIGRVIPAPIMESIADLLGDKIKEGAIDEKQTENILNLLLQNTGDIKSAIVRSENIS